MISRLGARPDGADDVFPRRAGQARRALLDPAAVAAQRRLRRGR